MKKNTFLRAALATALFLSGSAAQAKPLKVLMVGNSFSICVLKEMPACAANAGETLDLASLYIGGCSLERHWNNIEKASDPGFKPYRFDYSFASVKDAKDAPVAKLGKKTNIPQALTADRWDVVTIQQASPQSFRPETYQPYADRLIATIRRLAPQAEIVIQETWSYSPYSERFAKWKMTPDAMHTALKNAYAQLAAKYKLRVIPTGDAIQLYRQKLPVNYGTLLTRQEISALVQPQLLDFKGDVTGKSSWKKGPKGRTLHIDPHHLNDDGNYLQACTWLAALFGADVTKLTYAPAGLAAEKAKLMRACAAEAVAAERTAHARR